MHPLADVVSTHDNWPEAVEVIALFALIALALWIFFGPHE